MLIHNINLHFLRTENTQGVEQQVWKNMLPSSNGFPIEQTFSGDRGIHATPSPLVSHDAHFRARGDPPPIRTAERKSRDDADHEIRGERRCVPLFKICRTQISGLA